MFLRILLYFASIFALLTFERDYRSQILKIKKLKNFDRGFFAGMSMILFTVLIQVIDFFWIYQHSFAGFLLLLIVLVLIAWTSILSWKNLYYLENGFNPKNESKGIFLKILWIILFAKFKLIPFRIPFKKKQYYQDAKFRGAYEKTNYYMIASWVLILLFVFAHIFLRFFLLP